MFSFRRVKEIEILFFKLNRYNRSNFNRERRFRKMFKIFKCGKCFSKIRGKLIILEK